MLTYTEIREMKLLSVCLETSGRQANKIYFERYS